LACIIPFIRVIVLIRGSFPFGLIFMALIFERETYEILGACFEVYNEMGCGFVEPVYHSCLMKEFASRNVPHCSKKPLSLTYKGERLDLHFEPDFVCFGQVIVEIKAVKDLHDVFRAQVHNDLKATALKIGLLVNFGHYPKLEYERIIR
jgi:GxxExxY protein